MNVFRVLWLLALSTCCMNLLSAKEHKKPNILFLLVDDMGWKDTGFMGSDFYETPNLDAIAAESLIFTNGYSAAANCAPARACLLSGQYSARHKIYNVGTKPRGKSAHRRLEHIAGTDTLDPGIKTWAQVAKEEGYTTASIGKWHLSDDPIPYGFDVNIGGNQAGMPSNGYYPPHPNRPGLDHLPEGEYLTDSLCRGAVQFIRENEDRPWLLYLTHYAVHTPIEPKKELLDKYLEKPLGELHQSPEYATMVQSVDDSFGQIMATLEELGLEDDTIIVFYSDNGGYGPITDMAPLKGYKGTYYEGGIRVPFFIYWPKVLAEGRSTDTPMTGVDLYPTLCEMMGAALPEDQAIDGVSLVPLLTGEVLPERSLFWHFPAYLESYRGVTDEQRDPIFRSRPCTVIRKKAWKLHYYYEDKGLELYDLKNDIGEHQNLAETHVELTESLLSEMILWRETVGADYPLEPNLEFDQISHSDALKKTE